jgi:hypothetical protein
MSSYLGLSESKNARSVFYKNKVFTLCEHRIVATLRVCEERSICQPYSMYVRNFRINVAV